MNREQTTPCFWYAKVTGEAPRILTDPRGFLSIDAKTGEVYVNPDDDSYSGIIPRMDAMMFAIHILEREQDNFKQLIIEEWVRSIFGQRAIDNTEERCLRFGEEAFELIQATGHVSRDQLHQLVDYVYDRTPGEIEQELGGAAMTLFALATNLKHNIDHALNKEIDRVRDPQMIEKIRAKQAQKAANGVASEFP